MPRRKTLSDAAIAKLEPRPGVKSYNMPDPELPGHYVRVWASGAKSFAAVARAPSGKQVWHSIGAAPLLTIAKARTEARKAMLAIREGKSRGRPNRIRGRGSMAKATRRGEGIADRRPDPPRS